MNEYDKINESYYDFKLTHMVKADENILWQGKPDKKCFILESIFNPFLPFALIWFLVDSSFIGLITASGAIGKDHSLLYFLILFFTLHMMPVWIYLVGVIFSFKKHRNTEFIITDKAVYISGGAFNYNCYRKAYDKMCEIQIRQGFFDKMLQVGDVIIERYTKIYSKHKPTIEHAIIDISDFQNVYDLIIQLQENTQRRKQIQAEENSKPTLESPDDYNNTDIK